MIDTNAYSKWYDQRDKVKLVAEMRNAVRENTGFLSSQRLLIEANDILTAELKKFVALTKNL